MRKLPDMANVLMMDRYTRRDTRPKRNTTPMQFWKPELVKRHEDFSASIMRACAAKVWVFFGSPAQQKYLEEHPTAITFNFVEVGNESVKTKVALELDKRGQVCRVAIFCRHPESIYYFKSQEPLKGQEMDQALDLATALTAIMPRAQYFTRFYNGVHGQQGVSGQLLSEVMELLRRDTPSARVTYDEVGPRTTEWLKEQHIDGEAAFEVWRQAHGYQNLSLMASIHAELFAANDTNSIKRVTAKESSKFSAVYRMTDSFKGDPATILVKCPHCQDERIDHEPRFMLDGRYIVGTTYCQKCGHNGSSKRKSDMHARRMWPVDKDIRACAIDVMTRQFYNTYPHAEGAVVFRQRTANLAANKRAYRAKQKAAKSS